MSSKCDEELKDSEDDSCCWTGKSTNANNNTKKKSIVSICCFCFPKDDYANVLLLISLYIFQGIPIGLTHSIPYILVSRNVSFMGLATFSFTSWPFSFKLFWAPLVDSLYFNRFGRRKSWLVPVQYLLGFSMIVLSWFVTDWFGQTPLTVSPQNNSLSPSLIGNNTQNTSNNSNNEFKLIPLTISFFWLYFLAATQDIAVDGWALTMLSRANIGWASTCNVVGQTIGYSIAFNLFLVLESADFANKWLRSEPQSEGIVTFSGFLLFWGIAFVTLTTLVWIFKSENTVVSDSVPNLDKILNLDKKLDNIGIGNASDSHQMDKGNVNDFSERLSLFDCYRMLLRIVCCRPVQQYILTMVLVQFGLSASMTLTQLKLIERGVSKETIASLNVFNIPIQVFLPLLLSRFVIGPHPFTLYLKTAIPGTLYGAILAGFVFITPYLRYADKSFPFYHSILYVLVFAVYQTLIYTLVVCQMAFQAKISDPAVGGTYMTFMNTLSNLATIIPATIIMYLVDPFSRKYCKGGNADNYSCIGAQLHDVCVKGHGECITVIDGYYILSLICIVAGTVGIIIRKTASSKLEDLERSCWFVVPRNIHTDMSL